MERHHLLIRLLLTAAVLLILAACGGGGGSNEPSAIIYDVTGTAVKGPLANAIVKIYRFDPLQPDLKGALLSTGRTTDEAKISGVTIQSPLLDGYLVEVVADADTIDITTGQAPTISVLRGIVTANQLTSGLPISVTPLTTLATDLGRLKSTAEASDAEVLENIRSSAVTVIAKLGFGLENAIDIFSSQALVSDDDNTDVAAIAAYRTAIEAVTALIGMLNEHSSANSDELLEALAEDLLDGELNGVSSAAPVQPLAEIVNLANLLEGVSISLLAIPNTDQDGDPVTSDPYTVDDVEQMLAIEASFLGSTRDTTALSNGTIAIIPTPLSPDSDGDGMPDVTDPDIDNDGVDNNSDAFPLDANESSDTDGDGIGDNADPDADNDGVENSLDAFPLDVSESVDLDGDGVGDNADLDDDNDGVDDTVDAFPRDASESADTDSDGIGDNADDYPNDAACNILIDGNGTGCYSTLLGSVSIAKVIVDQNGIAYLHVPAWSFILRFDNQTQHYLEPISVGQTPSLSSMAYSASHERLYLGYSSGEITYIVLNGVLVEQPFASVGMSVNGLASVGQYILAQDNSGAWETHYLFDINGVLAHSLDWNHYSRVYAWNETNNRVFFFRDTSSPNDLHYEEINLMTGMITASGETPYHGDYLIVPPIRISQNGARVLLGSGDIYDANTLTWQGSIGTGFDDAVWMADGGLITVIDVAGQTRLERRDASLNSVVERLNYSGIPLGIFTVGSDYVVLTQSASGVSFNTYQPNDDTDGDGSLNHDDAFPLDLAASLDTDRDGYPDSWNDGRTATDSTTGLILDSYPLDSACYLPGHGDGVQCDYSSTMPVFTPDKSVIDVNGVVYLLSMENNRIFSWSADTSSFTNPIYVGSTDVLSATSPTQMTYSLAHQRLYLGYPSGVMTYIDLAGDLAEHPFANLPRGVNGLVSVGQYLLAQDSSGAWNTHYVFNQNGVLTSSADWNYYSQVYTWNEVNDRVYFFRDSQSPNDLHYENINQISGAIAANGETPYHGTYAIVPPIRISQDGSRVLLGSGDIYDANSLTWQGTLGTNFDDAVWLGNSIVTTKQNVTDSQIQIWDVSTLEGQGSYIVNDTLNALLPYGIDLIQVATGATGVSLSVVSIGDHDADGLPAWWEGLHGLDDTNLSDAGLDGDTDGLNNLQEFSLKTVPNNADSDNDGLSDGDEVNVHLTNPLNADSDADSISDGDEVLIYGTNPLFIDTDSDGLSDADEINLHGTNPLVTDSDADGMGDAWEIANALDPLANDASVDVDTDGLSNLLELANSTDPNDNDTDGDGLTDGDEVNVHLTNPTIVDSDGDRMRDGWEITYGFNPLSSLDASSDADSDGFSNMAEHFLLTDPNDVLSVPAASAWTTYQGGAGHTGFVPVVLDSANFSERWVTNPFSGRSLNPVTAADGQVFVSESTYYGTNQSIAALNAIDGSLAWERGYGNINSIYPPAYNNGKVYFQAGGYGASFLRGLDAVDGALVFRSSYNAQSSAYIAPTSYANEIYIAGAYGFDGSTGSEIWFASLNQNFSWTPAVDQNYVYAYTGDGVLSAINRTTGLLEYSISDPSSVTYWSRTPVLGGNQNAVVVNGGQLTSFDLQNQSIGWQRGTNFSGQPSLALGQIFTINSGALNVVDETTGAHLWAWEPPGGGSVSGNMIVTMNMVFLHDGTTTYAIDLDTHLSVWSYPAAGHLALSNEGALYIATGNGSLIAINVSGDDDGDGMPGWWETSYALDDADPADAGLDADGDGLTNLQEFENGTNPLISDTDNDGLTDSDELSLYLTNPKQSDSDGDGLSDGSEVQIHLTDPLASDTDLDGFSDGEEVNLYGTDPTDATSVPAALTSFNESFEGGVIPAGWDPASSSNADWMIGSTFSNTGSYSLRSGVIYHSQQSGVEFTGLFAAGTLSFSTRVDAESCCDRLYFYVDGVLVYTISANSVWANYQTNLTSGEHTLEWRYVKDGSVSTGTDAAWIDDIVFTTGIVGLSLHGSTNSHTDSRRGQDCMICHTSGPGTGVFITSGTSISDAGGYAEYYADSARTDLRARLEVDAYGNFYTVTPIDILTPNGSGLSQGAYISVVSANGARRNMPGAVSHISSSCNECHTVAGSSPPL